MTQKKSLTFECIIFCDTKIISSENQIAQAKANNSYSKAGTVYHVRVDLFKLKDRKSESEWEQLLLKWKKWGVLGYMRSYLASFFPGQEAKAKEIRLITDEIAEQTVLLQNEEERKDDEAQLDSI